MCSDGSAAPVLVTEIVRCPHCGVARVADYPVDAKEIQCPVCRRMAKPGAEEDHA